MRTLAFIAALMLCQSAECGQFIVGILATAIEVAPPPAPKPGVCETCNGTGRLGDGTVFVDCPDCDGPKAKPVAHKPVATHYYIEPTFSQGGCANGQCSPVRRFR